jgi:soluble lytic murein transglycosylase-like protein
VGLIYGQVMLQVLLLSVLLGQSTVYSTERVKEFVSERSKLLGNPLNDADALALAASVVVQASVTPVPLTLAVIETESKYVRKAKSQRACKGYMQLADGTAKAVAQRLNLLTYNIYDPKDNILLGTALLKVLIDEQKGNRARALTIYNAGWGGYIARGKKISGYAKAVLKRVKKLAKLLSYSDKNQLTSNQ